MLSSHKVENNQVSWPPLKHFTFNQILESQRFHYLCYNNFKWNTTSVEMNSIKQYFRQYFKKNYTIIIIYADGSLVARVQF